MFIARIRIFQMNVAADPQSAEPVGIAGTPTFVMFPNGREAGRVEGPSPNLSRVLTTPIMLFDGD